MSRFFKIVQKKRETFLSDKAPSVFLSDKAPSVFLSDKAPSPFLSDKAPSPFLSDKAPSPFLSDKAALVFLSDKAPSLETLQLVLSTSVVHQLFYISICISTLPTHHATFIFSLHASFVVLFQYLDPMFSSNGNFYIQVLPKDEGKNGKFLHIAKVPSTVSMYKFYLGWVKTINLLIVKFDKSSKSIPQFFWATCTADCYDRVAHQTLIVVYIVSREDL